MRTAYAVNLAGLQWIQLAALLERHKIVRAIDARAMGDATSGRFSRRSLERGYRGLYESWPNLAPYEVFERLTVLGELKQLLDTAAGLRLCFIHSGERFHLVPLLHELGWRAFLIGADGRLSEAPAAIRRPEASLRSLQPRV
jgi:hypothetical protein